MTDQSTDMPLGHDALILDDDFPSAVALSMRDQFAIAAMQGWLASAIGTFVHPADQNDGEAATNLARKSYVLADAMMKARHTGAST